jgi:fatty acid desaturase
MILRNPWLIAGGWLSVIASLLHVACIFGGPDWYRFFGAGEALAQADARGEWHPALITAGIAILLAIWAAYAFAGAGVIRRLPLIRTALVAISAIYVARGLFIIPVLLHEQARTPFNIWSSLIVLGYGIAYAVGTWRAWPHLKPATRLAEAA